MRQCMCWWTAAGKGPGRAPFVGFAPTAGLQHCAHAQTNKFADVWDAALHCCLDMVSTAPHVHARARRARRASRRPSPAYLTAEKLETVASTIASVRKASERTTQAVRRAKLPPQCTVQGLLVLSGYTFTYMSARLVICACNNGHRAASGSTALKERDLCSECV